MSEFDQLKNDAEKEAQEHPQQVKEGEQAVERPSPGSPAGRTATSCVPG